MRFRFCWDTDCPDWLLAEIATLATLSSVKLRLLVAHVADSVAGQPLDPAKVAKWAGGQDGADSQSAAACVGGLRWILSKAAGARVSGDLLDSELLQLGLPKEHAAALAKVYTERQAAMFSKLSESSGVNCCGGHLNFEVDVKGVDVAGEIEPILQLSMASSTVGAEGNPARICMTPDQLKVFLHELCEARQIMASLT